jgi:hypothetical protein
MELSSVSNNQLVSDFMNLRKKSLGGLLVGPVLVVTGIAQMAINAIALLFSPVSSFFLKQDSKWGAMASFSDAMQGLAIVIWGLFTTVGQGHKLENLLASAIKEGEMGSPMPSKV